MQNEEHGKGSFTIEDQRTLAQRYLNEGRFFEASSLFHELSLQCELNFGADDRITLRMRKEEAEALAGLKKYRKAMELLKYVLQRRNASFGTEDRDALEASYRLALLMSRCGRKETALSLAEKTYQIQRRVLGHVHPDTLASRLLLFILKPPRTVSEQEEEISRLYSLCSSALGDRDPVTLAALYSHAIICAKQRKYLQAALECEGCFKLFSSNEYIYPDCMTIMLRECGPWRRARLKILARVKVEMFFIALRWKGKEWVKSHLAQLPEWIKSMKPR